MTKKRRKSNFGDKVIGDARRRKRQRSSYGYLDLPKGVKIFSLKEDTRKINLDFIPYEVTNPNHPDHNDDDGTAVVGSLWYKRPFKIHRSVGADNDSFICLTSIKKKCPICEFVTKKRKEGADWDEIKTIAAKDRNLYAVLPINSKDHDEVIHVWDMAQFLFQDELQDQLEEVGEAERLFPDLEKGRTLEIKFKWKTFGSNKFPETRDVNFKDREEQYDENILDEVPNLDELLTILSYKELEAKFFETEEDDDDDVIDDTSDEEEKDDEPPVRKRKTRKVEEEEAEEEEEEEDEEEDEEKPKRTSRRKRESQSNKKNKCPHNHKFGKDWSEYDDCDDCDEWDDCSDEHDK